MAYKKLIVCDGCSCYEDYPASISKKVINQDARNRGWRIGK